MKKLLILALFLFGWLFLLESCIETCGGGPSVCVNLENVEAVAYDQQSGRQIMAGASVESSNLLINAFPVLSRATCMIPRQLGGLIACSPTSPYFLIEVKEVSLISSADISANYKAGEELSPVFESFFVYELIEGEPITSFDNAGPRDIAGYNYSINANWPSQLVYGTENSFDVLRFREAVEVASGVHTLTVRYTLEDNSILTTSTTVEIM